MKKNNLLFYFFAFFVLFQIKANFRNNIIEEASFKEASSIFIIQTDSIFKKKYNKIYNIYREKNFIVALKQALNLLDEVKVKSNPENLFMIISLVADIYDKTNKYSNSLDYYKSSLSILKQTNILENSNLFSNPDYAKILLRIGSAFQKLEKKDSATYYYSKLEAIQSLNTDVLGFKAVSFNNLSGLYELDSLYGKAKEYAIKAINIHRKRNDKAGEATALNNLANIYLSQGNFEKAKELYIQGIELIENNNSANAIRFKGNLYYNLAWAMRSLKDYKAYDFQELSYEIEDGIRNKEVRTMIEEVTAQYDVKGVKKEEENKRLKDQRTFWVFGIGSILVILSLLYWINIYKLRQKNLGLKLSQTQLIQSQKIEKIKSDSQIRILNATIDGKESERKEIAETLHDSVSALLSSANLHLQATRSQFNGNTPVEVDKTQQIITEASQKIRDLSHTLVSSVLLKFGLKFAIKDMADKYSNSQINIKSEIGKVRRYNQNFEIKAYNMIQELLNNILKHSKAKNATVNLTEKDKKLYLKITDDGIGFDKTKITEKAGLGINQIDARIQMMNGFFYIDSTKNDGTIINIELPILEKEKVNLV